MRTLSVWTRPDPFGQFDALIRSAFGGPDSSFVPAAETVRDGDDAVIRLELPGVDFEKDVTVEVDRGHLVVRGERKDERSETRDGRVLRELRYGSFHRSFVLPTHLGADAVSASYDRGMLSIRVAGAYRDHEAKRIAITTN